MPTTGPARAERQASSTSFVRPARRDQLVRSAIEVIADLGLDQASEVKIARRAGVSRGVLAYHFRDGDDLVDAVLAEVYRLGGERLSARVADAPTPRDAMLTFVGGSVDFYAEFPRHILALREIFAARRRAGRTRGDTTEHARELDDVSALLRAGQEAGQFRSFEVSVMADIVRSVVDAAVPRALDPATDVDRLRSELVDAVDALLRAR